uniref:Uncharacterized protein n=1 Tax=Romanomermis culicivorax TaxID=13658 RepID=A0A915JAQ6_ROMCU
MHVHQHEVPVQTRQMEILMKNTSTSCAVPLKIPFSFQAIRVFCLLRAYEPSSKCLKQCPKENSNAIVIGSFSKQEFM